MSSPPLERDRCQCGVRGIYVSKTNLFLERELLGGEVLEVLQDFELLVRLDTMAGSPGTVEIEACHPLFGPKAS